MKENGARKKASERRTRNIVGGKTMEERNVQQGQDAYVGIWSNGQIESRVTEEKRGDGESGPSRLLGPLKRRMQLGRGKKTDIYRTQRELSTSWTFGP